MIEKITYIAFDGEEFETKEACATHEKSLSEMSEHVQLFAADLSPIEWNPGDYSSMWDELTYIVIKPHHEEEAEKWWDNTFFEMLNVSPFKDIGYDWKIWKKGSHDNKPVVIIYDYQGSGYWEIFNNIYAEVNKIADALF